MYKHEINPAKRFSRSVFMVLAVAAICLAVGSILVFWPGTGAAKGVAYLGTEEEVSLPRKLIGPLTGRVVDAETGKPIAGAQVRLRILFQGIEMLMYDKYVCRYGVTDSDGKYKLDAFMGKGKNRDVIVDFVVYKAGYLAYLNGQTFRDFSTPLGFKVRNNQVKLVKWDDTKMKPEDHVRHVELIGCGSMMDVCEGQWKEHQAFCREAREEMIEACLIEYTDRTKKLCEEIIDERIGLREVHF